MSTVLIADDEANLRLLVSASLASEDCDIVEAANGDEAWDLILRHRPQVAILDVQMPGRTGLDLTRAIKSATSLNGTQVILLTSKARPSDIDAGTAAGADIYLTKPFLPVELLVAVERALNAVP
jgi:CheY-like chemotaxis protein